MERNNKEKENLIQLLSEKIKLIKSMTRNPEIKIPGITGKIEAIDDKIIQVIRNSNYTIDEF